MQRVASKAPANFAPQVKDTQKRLNLLFDHLNNEELVQPPTIDQLSQLAEALEARNYDVASQIQVEVQKTKTEECGNWMVSCHLDDLRFLTHRKMQKANRDKQVGVKRLISMSKATP